MITLCEHPWKTTSEYVGSKETNKIIKTTSKRKNGERSILYNLLADDDSVKSRTIVHGPVCLYWSCMITLNSLVTAVPFPLVSGLHWEEVCRSLVLHSLWKPQQDSVVEVPHTRMIRRPEGKGNRKGMSQIYLEHLQHEQK